MAERIFVPWRRRIDGPCSACGDGDTAMRYHNHEPPSPSYTLDQLQQLASTYIEQLPAPVSRLSVSLMMSAWLKWMEKREKESKQ